MTQLLAIEFTPGGRSYTYHNDGEAVRLDERVVVMTKRGPEVVRVVSINPKPPTVPTKAIIGKHDGPVEAKPVQQRLL